MDTITPTPPDGGWGWLVVVGAFVINLLTAGSSWAYGVLYVALLDALGGTKAETALVGSLVYMVLVFMAPYASALCRRYGHRRVIMIGGATASASIIGSSFTTSITQLYYTYGVLTGFGYGCCLVPSFLIVQQYFKKRLGVAMGIAMAGAGFGMFLMAFLTQQLLSNYDWRGTMLILGAINANLCMAAALMRPVSHVKRTRRLHGNNDITNDNQRTLPLVKKIKRKYSLSVVATYRKPVVENPPSVLSDTTQHDRNAVKHGEENEIEDRQTRTINHEGSSHDISAGICSGTTVDFQQTEDEETVDFHSSNNDIKSSLPEISAEAEQNVCCRYPLMALAFFDEIYNFSLFKDPVYVIFQVSVIAGFMSLSIITTHLVKRALDFGISQSGASSLVYGMGIGQVAGRTLGGVAVDHIPMNKVAMCAITLFLAAAATEASTYLTSYIGQQVSLFAIGFTFGGTVIISTGVLVDVFGAELLSYTISVCYLFGGIGTIVGPTVAGYMRDKYGKYDSAFHLATVADIFCGILMLFMIPFIRLTRSRRLRTHEPVVSEDPNPNEPSKTPAVTTERQSTA